MGRRGESIFLRKDGRWEGRYIKEYTSTGKAIYGYVYAKTYNECKRKRTNILLNIPTYTSKESNQNIELNILINHWLNSK